MRNQTANQRKAARKNLIKRDGDLCFYCGIKMKSPTIEHLVNHCDGGSFEYSNLVLCHGSCNKYVGNCNICTKLKVKKILTSSHARKLFLSRAVMRSVSHIDFIKNQMDDFHTLKREAKS